MKEAFANSNVWFYQEIARRIGEKRMKEWVRKTQYGNQNTGGGIDSFWLTGNLRITPKQQMNFLRKLYMGTLPFSKRSMDITKKIMIREQTATYTLRGKTGWAQSKDTTKTNDIGWFVGWLEQNGNVYFFATRVFNTDPENTDFAPARIDITKAILQKELGLM
jgi:beta-lactamase class D